MTTQWKVWVDPWESPLITLRCEANVYLELFIRQCYEKSGSMLMNLYLSCLNVEEIMMYQDIFKTTRRQVFGWSNKYCLNQVFFDPNDPLSVGPRLSSVFHMFYAETQCAATLTQISIVVHLKLWGLSFRGFRVLVSVRTFGAMYDHSFLCLQISRSDIRQHVQWPVNCRNFGSNEFLPGAYIPHKQVWRNSPIKVDFFYVWIKWIRPKIP